MNCRAVIHKNGNAVAEGTGELQFTEYGISGPLIFEISRNACRSAGTWNCILDFMPEMEEVTLRKWLHRKKQSTQKCDELLTGILHNRLGRVLCATAGISSNKPISDLTDDEISGVIAAVKRLDINLTEPLGMDSAQVTAGGIVTTEFDPNTMESRLVPGLYACGEVLDVDGDCGGYNLQWAWSSGRLAGQSATGGAK